MIIRQRVLPNARLGNNVGIWEGSIVYEVLYYMFKVEAIASFMVGFLVVVTYSLRFQVGGKRLGMGVGSRGLMNPLEVIFSYAWARVIPRSKNSRWAFFVKLR